MKNFWNWLKSLFTSKPKEIPAPAPAPEKPAEIPTPQPQPVEPPKEVPIEKPPVEVPAVDLVPDAKVPVAWFDKALSLTGSFEGKGFGAVSGNFDGMGISAGILQWNFGTGSLQYRILNPYKEKYGTKSLEKEFPASIVPLLSMSNDKAVKWCEANMHTPNLKTSDPNDEVLKTAWKDAWEKFMTKPEVIELQKIASRGVAKKAADLMRSWNLDSIRAFCWFYDLVTQNGGLEGVTKVTPTADQLKRAFDSAGSNKEIWSSEQLSAEQEILLWASHKRSRTANPQWIMDVYSRKGTIAVGKGIVHGSLRSYPELKG